jgi:hypothetical protein
MIKGLALQKGVEGENNYGQERIVALLSEFWVLDIRVLSALVCGLRSPVPRGHVLGGI